MLALCVSHAEGLGDCLVAVVDVAYISANPSAEALKLCAQKGTEKKSAKMGVQAREKSYLENTGLS